MANYGIDVSKWQGGIDWQQVAGAGIQFAMIRASYGSDGKDPYFSLNMQNAPAAGIHCGAYHYCYALSVEEAKREADHFLNTIAPYSFSYPVALDIEDPSMRSLGKAAITDIALAFVQAVQEAGYYVCIYSNANWFTTNLELERLSEYDLWLAQWADAPTFEGDNGIWQYTSKGQLPGISGNVDRNLSYRDYPSIISNKGLNQAKDPGSTPSAPSTDPSPSPSGSYTVKSGDTLSQIAVDHGVSLQELLNANPSISDPNLIRPGQIIRIPGASGSSSSSNGSYTVKSGDTLSQIAVDYGVSLQQLLNANPSISDPNLIRPGQIIRIPG